MRRDSVTAVLYSLPQMLNTLEALPKALLHDHLDGGLRIETILELADAVGYDGLPEKDPEALRGWFVQAESGSLERYLEAFDHTVAVMATQDAIRRVAYEAGTDLAADGVVYAEVRFGPALHLPAGLALEATIEAVLDGFAAATRDHGIALYAIVTALRQHNDSETVARAACHYVGRGVVAFDLAGPEAGFPADDHLPACLVAREAGLGLTIHAGEGDGPDSIWRALARCGAQRIGHGVRVIDDTEVGDGKIVAAGPLATRVRDHRIPLEVSPTSNVHTGVFPDIPRHAFGPLFRAGFNVTINTDNRLMSGITLSDEYAALATAFGLDIADLGTLTENALRAGFGDWPTRQQLIEEVVRPAYDFAV